MGNLRLDKYHGPSHLTFTGLIASTLLVDLLSQTSVEFIVQREGCTEEKEGSMHIYTKNCSWGNGIIRDLVP